MMKTIALFLLVLATAPLLRAESTAALIEKGDALDAQLKSKEALAIYLQAEQQDPDNVVLLIKIAKQYGDSMNDEKSKAASKARGEKALDYAKKAYALAPNDADANLTMAICHGKLTGFMSNKEKVAISKTIKDYADKAIALNPKSDYAWHLRGRWNQELAAMGGFTKGLANTFLGGLPDASFDQALLDLDKARKIRPDRLLHQVEYGRTLIMMGRKEEGKKELAKGLAMPNLEKDDPETKRRGQKTLDDA